MVVVAFVDVEFVVMMFVAFKLVIVATAAVRESAIALVKRASVEKNEVDVALLAMSEDENKFVEVELVMVAFEELRFCTVEELNAMSPALNVRSVDVAPFTNASWTVVPVASAPQTSTPAAVALTSQLAAFKFETISCDVDAVPETARFVVVAFVAVTF